EASSGSEASRHSAGERPRDPGAAFFLETRGLRGAPAAFFGGMVCPSRGRDYIMALRMDEQSRRDDSENPARTHFHLVLGLILIPPAAAIAGAFFALSNALRPERGPAQRRWTKLLAALALVDVLVVASFVGLYGHAEELQQ